MSEWVTYKGHRIQVYLEGTGEPLLFLHGWPTNSSLWCSQIAQFKSQFRVVTLDWLGFGRSDKPLEHHYTFEAMSEVLDAVLAAVLRKTEKVTIVAHDIGGPPAILWASTHEPRVRRLILLNTIIYPFKTRTDAFSEILMKIPGISVVFFSNFGLKWIMKMNTRSSGRSLDERIGQILTANMEIDRKIRSKTIQEPLHEGRKELLHSLSERFRALSVPKYLIMAKSDPLCYQHVLLLSRQNPEVPGFYLKDCGHFMPIDRPDALNEVLGEILS